MLTVHHLRISQSERIVWLCEELGLDYDLKLHERRKDNFLAPDDYKALHPAGTAPIVNDGAVVLAESGAIIDYIVVRHGSGHLVPAADSPDLPAHLFWFHFANGGFMPTTMQHWGARRSGVEVPPFVAERRRRMWDMAEQRLGVANYFGGGDLTTADIMMGFPLITMRSLTGETVAEHPNICAWLRRVGERPAFQRAMAKAEPGMPLNLQ
ncbi:glutathione S-transferase family protein [Novosphingobium sp. EMRT-2]|uniref:glutathione S-transferase family protein n=1 Tax=Novosphingobium sp. EMRT-2 TaxID=2571749 RepID=UPI0010BDC149|nr:glutathione S-transferase family protein [Novosphingobium sp. EMRT-2]QCI92386.1 glutathione S-transferase family protein [Novosphingobium sp. EMRT-2]